MTLVLLEMNQQRIALLAKKWLPIAHQHERLIAGILFAGIVMATLTAGLWPFSAPTNDAQWMPGQNGIRFVHYGTALSRGSLKFPSASTTACTIELRLKPRITWTRGTPLAFYDPADRTSFEVRQSYADLQLVTTSHLGGSDFQERSLQVADVFLKPEFLLTITSDRQQTLVYVNGRLVAKSSSLAFSSSDLAGRLILGNSPVRNRQWAGQIKGLAVYEEQLNAATIVTHTTEWMAEGAPLFNSETKPVAFYSFRDGGGRVIHDAGTWGLDLELPARYVTVDQVRFEGPSSEAHDSNYKDDAIFNIEGFIPLGFIGALFFSRFSGKGSAAASVIALGFATSLAIEYFQSFLPTRFSGTTDLFTNTLGTACGVLACFLVLRLVPKKKLG